MCGGTGVFYDDAVCSHDFWPQCGHLEQHFCLLISQWLVGSIMKPLTWFRGNLNVTAHTDGVWLVLDWAAQSTDLNSNPHLWVIQPGSVTPLMLLRLKGRKSLQPGYEIWWQAWNQGNGGCYSSKFMFFKWHIQQWHMGILLVAIWCSLLQESCLTSHCDMLNEANKLWDFIVNIIGSRTGFPFWCITLPTVALVHCKFIPHACLMIKKKNKAQFTDLMFCNN